MLADLLSRFDRARTLLVDGRSGAGKSSLARAVAAARPEARLIRLDDIYPGWDGLHWASDHIRTSVLEPRERGERARWRSWDWAADRPGVWHEVDDAAPLIVEGIGTLTARSRRTADLAVWVEAPDADRKRRALARDGELYAPHWDRWAAQEEHFIMVERPRAAADYIARAVDGDFELTPTGETA
ncbi:ATP-binding protein [Microbacterium terricola]|uniref:Adenylate kinase n=1 Tax=Microbacterium terricola TaxID=344163 RepID=A0ABM8DZS5_9MICO|nr:ATP-binding protein [Microbacterium terricola]UYK41064.1 ATP-binding protein [Microbacterium terricola]BDV31177.1 adenylate kinase [Microbacterium terricola]